MKTRLWVTAAVAGLLAVALLAPAALTKEKKTKPAAGSKTEQAMPPGCGMHGAAMGAGEKGMGAGKAGCGMHGAGMGAGEEGMSPGKAGCGMGGPGMQCCCMKCCKGGVGMGGCGMKGGAMGRGMCGPAMGRGMGAGMCGPGMRGGMGGGMYGPGMGCGIGLGLERLRELDLSAEQKAKLTEIGERWMRLAIQKQADVRLAMLDLQKSVRDERPDKMKIDAAIDKVARLRADLAKSCFGARLEARSVLTPEQLKKWREVAKGEGEEED